ncbi:hypothetical protein WN944_013453 [Citrus x changshan-huyou]|uniref:Uncharacterized protein n=1 Tax=Citrus x changshan-huyou TaxID=2935761 RepID=A0AAP0M512_9ROSI
MAEKMCGSMRCCLPLEYGDSGTIQIAVEKWNNNLCPQTKCLRQCGA